MQPRTGTQASVSAGSSDRCERWLRQSGFLDGCFSNPSAHTPAHTHFGGLMERQSLMWWVWDGAWGRVQSLPFHCAPVDAQPPAQAALSTGLFRSAARERLQHATLAVRLGRAGAPTSSP